MEPEDPVADARSRLWKRLLLAGVLILALLGALAVFEHQSKAPSEREPAKPVRPVTTAPGPAVGPTLRSDGSYPVGPPPPPPIQETVAAAPKVEPPPKPEVAAQPAAAPAPAVPSSASPPVPASAPAPGRPPRAGSAPVSPAPPAAVQAVPEETSGGEIKPAPAQAGAASPAPAAPVPPVVPAAAATAPRPPAHPLLRRGYLLQAGVFTSTERAEELKARLIMAGVPVTVETRVQVGPFSTAREAAAAREKIKALGIEAILIPPARPPRPAAR